MDNIAQVAQGNTRKPKAARPRIEAVHITVQEFRRKQVICKLIVAEMRYLREQGGVVHPERRDVPDVVTGILHHIIVPPV
jgi:hypothetical protein